MLEYSRWKYAVLALIMLFAAVYSSGNLFPQDPSVQISAGRGATVDAALQSRVEAALSGGPITPKSIEIVDGSLLVRLDDVVEQQKAAEALRPVLGQDYIAALSLASTVPDWLADLGAKPMSLGLDLQGGVHFLMEVDVAAATNKRFEGILNEIRTRMRDQRLVFSAVRRTATGVEVVLRDPADRAAAMTLVREAVPGLQLTEGAEPNLFSGALTEEEMARVLDETMEQNTVTLRNRINELGVSESIVQRQGASRVVVQLPGVQDTARAKAVIGATATLEYRAAVEGDAIAARDTGRVPPGAKLYESRTLGPDGRPQPVLLSREVIASGDQLTGASSGMDPQSGTPKVDVQLNASGGQRMLEFTRNNVGKPMAVVFIERIPETRIVDGKEVQASRVREQVISLATIQGVFGPTFQTTGLDSPEEANQLALLLRAGSLAAPMDIIEERVIGPSLGAENIKAGVSAVTFSFLLVMVFFIVYYKTFGLITNVALLINLLMVVALMSLIGATLTLPGLAGIALTVGMSVDANVLINERIREELREGNTPLASIANGYDKAAGTIADANITAMLAGIALFAFGTGPVKGFAITLILGILTSMYSAVSASRGIATFIYGRRRKLAGLSI
ncbi:MAG: protein translocase subunit SecD [Xanthomonadales bacterium]|nr:protein translocase subunit SecD [Xanthomonadales bacterium]